MEAENKLPMMLAFMFGEAARIAQRGCRWKWEREMGINLASC